MAMAENRSPAPRAPLSAPEGDENAVVGYGVTAFKDINESKADLLARVQSLRKDLRDWRGKLDNQVQTYRQELGELRNSLNVEVEQLKTDFQDLRLSLKKQLDATSKLSELIPLKFSSPKQFVCEKEYNLCFDKEVKHTEIAGEERPKGDIEEGAGDTSDDVQTSSSSSSEDSSSESESS